MKSRVERRHFEVYDWFFASLQRKELVRNEESQNGNFKYLNQNLLTLVVRQDNDKSYDTAEAVKKNNFDFEIHMKNQIAHHNAANNNHKKIPAHKAAPILVDLTKFHSDVIKII